MRRHSKLTRLRPFALLTCLLLVTPGCGGSDDEPAAEGEGEEEPDPESNALDATDDEMTAGLIDLDNGFLPSFDDSDRGDDTRRDGLAAEGIPALIRAEIDEVNAMTRRALDLVRNLTRETPTAKGKRFRLWEKDSPDGKLRWRFNLLRGDGAEAETAEARPRPRPEDATRIEAARKRFFYGLLVRKVDGDGDFKRILWGAFEADAPRRGAGRLNIDFDRLAEEKEDAPIRRGKVEVEFEHADDAHVFRVRREGFSRDADDRDGITVVHEYTRRNDDDGARRLRFAAKKKIRGDDGERDWIAGRAKWHPERGGRVDVVAWRSGDEAQAIRAHVRGCWDANAANVRITDSEIDEIPKGADAEDSGCPEGFRERPAPERLRPERRGELDTEEDNPRVRIRKLPPAEDAREGRAVDGDGADGRPERREPPEAEAAERR